MVSGLTSDQLLEEVSGLGETAPPGAAAGFLLELSVDVLELLMVARIDSHGANLWLAEADLQAADSVERERTYAANQGSLSPIVLDVRRLRRTAFEQVSNAAARFDLLVACTIEAARGSHAAQLLDEQSRLAREAFDAVLELGRIGIRLLGIALYLAERLPAAQHRMLVLAGATAFRAVSVESERLVVRLRHVSADVPHQWAEELDAVTGPCKERFQRLLDTTASV